MFQNIPPFPVLMIQFIVIVLAIGFHEYCHAKFADMAGDDTPRMMGRVTLNPLKHLDPLGTVLMMFTLVSGYGLGWGKPVMVRPERMQNPRWDHFTSVAAGPISNLLQAVIFAMILRFGLGTLSVEALRYGNFGSITDLIGVFCFFGVLTNVSMFVFNLIPLGPLDGHWLVGAFIPEPGRTAWYKFNHGPGMIIFLLLALMPAGPFDILGHTMRPAVDFLIRKLTGLPF